MDHDSCLSRNCVWQHRRFQHLGLMVRAHYAYTIYILVAYKLVAYYGLQRLHYMCVHTFPRELNEVAILSNLLGNVVDHTVHVGCDKLLLESFQFCILPQSHKVFHPLLSLCYMYKGRKITNNCVHVHPITPLHKCRGI